MQPDIRAPFKMGLNRELEGLLVVSMDQAVAAPYCALMLADAGARVIKVERIEGDFGSAAVKPVNHQGLHAQGDLAASVLRSS